MKFVLVGAGGHAKGVVDVIHGRGGSVAVYVDAQSAGWLDAPHQSADDSVRPQDGMIALGLGGMTPDALARRLALFERYRERGFAADPLIHPAGWASNSAKIGAGTVVLAGAVVQPGVSIGEAVIVNSGAIVEHDSVVGDGAHIAPGAIVLGNCRVGRCCMIGAGAVLLPGTEVADNTLVAASTRWHGASRGEGKAT